MPILGAHMSIAGGYHKAVERAAMVSCQCVQIFTKNNNQWTGKPISTAEAELFRATIAAKQIVCPVAHSSYLINLASPEKPLWQKSVDAFGEELRRADILGIPYVIIHPGSYTTSDPEAGICRVVDALNEIQNTSSGGYTQCLLETTAGQGTSLGWQFEQLAGILDGVRRPDRMGVCFDTAHVFAAGYRLQTPKEYEATMALFDDTVGVERIRAFHLNDSLRDCGSRVDRHAHIGRGRMGLAPFRFLLNDPRFAAIPMYLETPKDTEEGEAMDVVNLRTLRGLVQDA
jgi:deoxyribonuclease-4